MSLEPSSLPGALPEDIARMLRKFPLGTRVRATLTIFVGSGAEVLEGTRGTVIARHDILHGIRWDTGAMFQTLPNNFDPIDDGDAGPCIRCKELEQPFGGTVTWRCAECNAFVCARCVKKVPGRPHEILETTLCSDACWEKAGRPDE